MADNCIVKGCVNKKGQGNFFDDLCAPCYNMITLGNVQQKSTNFIHALYLENKKMDWVKLSERKPVDGQLCRCWTGQKFYDFTYSANLSCQGESIGPTWISDKGTGFQMAFVTHWKPQPSPPWCTKKSCCTFEPRTMWCVDELGCEFDNRK